MVYSDYEREILDELRREEIQGARFRLVTFLSWTQGKRKRRNPREILLVFDTYLHTCRTLKNDWFDRADEVEYRVTGDALIQELLKYGYA